MSVIAVVTAGEVDAEAAVYAEGCLRSVLKVETRRLAPLPPPAYAFDASRNQFSSTLVMHDAIGRRPKDALRLLVLTESDIFIPILSFVYGQAQLDGPVAVLSFARLHQRFYGLPENRPLFLDRVRKEVLHEIGHTLGLTHCEERGCSMSLSTNIQQLDTKGSDLCPGCDLLLRDSLAAKERNLPAGSSK